MTGSTTNGKKRYETPIFYLENYELSQAIAVGCAKSDLLIPLQASAMTCKMAIENDYDGQASAGDYFLFIANLSCHDEDTFNNEKIDLITVEKDGFDDGQDPYLSYCYHIPYGNVLFSS